MTLKRGLFLTLLPLRGVRNGGNCRILAILHIDKVSTHVWRATLNTEWMQKGVPDLIRSAYFGHSPEVNRSYYTDTTNVSVWRFRFGGHAPYDLGVRGNLYGNMFERDFT